MYKFQTVFTMRKSIFILLFFLCQVIQAQSDFSIEKFDSRFRLSGESINMKGSSYNLNGSFNPDGEPNIGMIGIGYDIFGLIKKYPNLFLGVNSYSAMSGDRAGIFSFGVAVGYKQPIIKKSLFAELSFFVGGGGGGRLKDGGGLILRPSLEFEKTITDIVSLRAGVSRIDFPSGVISSTHFNFGVVFNEGIYFANRIKKATLSDLVENENTNRIRVSLIGTLYNNFHGEVLSDTTGDVNVTYTKGNQIKLIGAEVSKFLTPNLYATVEFNGAVTGGIDGYMSYFLGGGFHYPMFNNRIFYDLRVLAGSSGGGGVATGGGASFQIETGLGVKLFKSYELKLLGGRTFAPWGTFDATHFDLSLGKSFDVYKNDKLKLKEKKEVSSKNYMFQEMGFTVFNRSYIPPNLKDQNGIKYDEFFNLIGFELTSRINNYLSVVGSTIWAYQGDYGAYGEGWLGLAADYDIHDDWMLVAKGMVGAGGGGGIDLGAGLFFQYSLGFEKIINDRLNFILNAGQVKPLEGNFTPIHIDLGIKLKINKIIKK